jgi:hypothetical protein
MPSRWHFRQGRFCTIPLSFFFILSFFNKFQATILGSVIGMPLAINDA